MALSLLRAGIFILIASVLLVSLTLYAGHNVATLTATEYMKLDERLYPLTIRDTRSTISIHLAGSRCYAAVPIDPETLAVRMQYERGIVQQYQVVDSQPELALTRLRCP